jgi:hypothetical protein
MCDQECRDKGSEKTELLFSEYNRLIMVKARWVLDVLRHTKKEQKIVVLQSERILSR